jgi:hypothetical protein
VEVVAEEVGGESFLQLKNPYKPEEVRVRRNENRVVRQVSQGKKVYDSSRAAGAGVGTEHEYAWCGWDGCGMAAFVNDGEFESESEYVDVDVDVENLDMKSKMI